MRNNNVRTADVINHDELLDFIETDDNDLIYLVDDNVRADDIDSMNQVSNNSPSDIKKNSPSDTITYRKDSGLLEFDF